MVDQAKVSKVRVVVWIDGVEHGSAESDVPENLAPFVAQAALVHVEDPDLDLARENETNQIRYENIREGKPE